MEFKSYSTFAQNSQRVDIAPDAPLSAACDLIAEQRVEQLAVFKAGKWLGSITESDILRHVSQNGGLSQTCVAQIMRVVDPV